MIPENIHTIPRTAFQNSEGKGGSLNWKSEGMRGYLQLEFQRHGGVEDKEFPLATDKSVFHENAYFKDLISLQIKHELTTLLTTRIQDKHRWIRHCVRVHLRKKTNKISGLYIEPEAQMGFSGSRPTKFEHINYVAIIKDLEKLPPQLY